ncbi:MAG TPA: methylmalonyl Co-A mutase-associated GTPase MeaB, partial [Geobacteraceae bacterium]|nr:methylmalonyl Co-A mutase-associated GTPase MeaB [Geobacteraceae bacterium]
NPDKDRGWRPKVLKTEASRNRGIEELVAELEAHREYLHSSGAINHVLEEKTASLFMDVLKERLFEEVYGHIHVNGRFRAIMEEMMARRTDPYTAVEEILVERFGIGGS